MSVNNNMNVFTSSINNLPDLAKNFLWQAIIIPEEGTPLATLFKNLGGTEQFTLRCKKITIPERSIDSTLETHYMGSKKTYPGRTKMDGEMNLSFDEYQDFTTSNMIHSWLSLIYNGDIGEDGGDIATGFGQLTGGAVSNYMKDYSSKIKITIFDSTLKNRLGYEWILYQCWPKTMSSVELNQEGQEKIQREATFFYNTYEMIKTGQENE